MVERDVEQLQQALTALEPAERGGGCLRICPQAGEFEISRGVSAARTAFTGSWNLAKEVPLKSLSGCVDVASRERASN
jgi:hypothetical protein